MFYICICINIYIYLVGDGSMIRISFCESETREAKVDETGEISPTVLVVGGL